VTAATSATFDEAEDHYGAGNFHASNNSALELIATYGIAPYSCFLIGRNYRYLGDYAAALAWLRMSLSLDVFCWVYYELAIVQALCQAELPAGESILRFLTSARDPSSECTLTTSHHETILDIAHQVFSTDRNLAVSIYHAAKILGVGDYLSDLRIAEALLEDGSLKEACEQLASIRVNHELDAWGYLVLSRLHQLRGEPLLSRDALRLAMIDQTFDLHLLLQSAHRLLELGFAEDASSVCDTLRSQPQRETAVDEVPRLVGLELRIASRQHDAARATEVLSSTNNCWEKVDKWLLVEAMFAFTLPGDQVCAEDLVVSELLCSSLEASFTGTLAEVHALLHFYCRECMWSKAETLLEGIRSSDLYEHPEMVLRRFEILCFSGDQEGARRLYSLSLDRDDLTCWEAMAAIRYLAEQKDWTRAGELLTGALRRGHSFPGCTSLLFQVARRASLCRELLFVLDEVALESETAGSKDLLLFRQMLVDDLCIRTGVKELEGAGRIIHHLSPENEILFSYSGLCLPSSDNQLALFLCVDRAYVLAALTFLCSYAAHHRRSARAVEVYVFLSNDVPTSWEEVIDSCSRTMGTPVNILREEQFVTAGMVHSESYGIFTGGGTLARAAYFRLYAARYLLKLHAFSRLCYIDSDIVCQGELSELFDLDLGGCLLAARIEEMSAEVRDAALRNSVEPESYFNSGVLLIDAAQQATAGLIDRAIHFSECEPERLTFHDQCALNIAFAGKAKNLPQKYNTFVRPNRPDNKSPEACKLLHFLDRPKPWDVSYAREYRVQWTRYAELVKCLLDPSEFRSIVIAANGGAIIEGGSAESDARALSVELEAPGALAISKESACLMDGFDPGLKAGDGDLPTCGQSSGDIVTLSERRQGVRWSRESGQVASLTASQGW